MLHISGAENGAALFDALNSDIRLKILNIIKAKEKINLNSLAKDLGITGGAVTAHIKKLSEVGLIKVQTEAGVRGSQKLCSLAATRIVLDLFDEKYYPKNVYSFDIGIGLYSDHKIFPTCGIVSDALMPRQFDEPRYFSFPERINARLLWFSHGYITYQLPNSLNDSEACTELQIGVELASEAPGYSSNYPSDIGFRLNGKHIGTFTSSGEYNDRPGLLTPSWWLKNLGQYGRFILITIEPSGCYISGTKVSGITLQDLQIQPRSDIYFTIEVAEDAVNRGGVTVFGKGFGDFDSGIDFKMFYEQKNK